MMQEIERGQNPDDGLYRVTKEPISWPFGQIYARQCFGQFTRLSKYPELLIFSCISYYPEFTGIPFVKYP